MTKRKLILTLVLLVSLFAFSVEVADAAGSDYPTPYHGRVYTHRIPVRFYMDDGIARYYFGRIWAHVFDIPGVPNSGYTAVDIREVSNDINNPKLYYDYFELLHWPRRKDYYLLSGKEWSGTLFLDKAATKYDKSLIKMETKSGDSYTRRVGAYRVPNASSDNPAVFPSNNRGPLPSNPADVAYDGEKFAYVKGMLPSVVGNDSFEGGWTELNSIGAKSVLKGTAGAAGYYGYSDVWVRFPYNAALAVLEQKSAASEVGEKEKWTVMWVNQTPYATDEDKTTLRAYIKNLETGKMSLVAEESVAMGTPWDARSIGNWTFEVPKPSFNYQVVVTIDMRWDGSRWVEENLVTLNPIRGYTYSMYGPLGHKETTYIDNILTSDQMTGSSPPDGGTVIVYPDDLAAVKIEVLDSDGNPVTQLQEGHVYRVRATYQSGFNVGGFARLRLYRYDIKNKRLYLQGEEYEYFSPNGTEVCDFGNYGWGAGLYTLIATVCYRNSGNDPTTGWVAEKFDGKHTEATYDNNKITLNVGVGENPYSGKPQPSSWSYNLYYPPERTETVEVYEELLEPVYGWKEVQFTKEEGEGGVRVRLVE